MLTYKAAYIPVDEGGYHCRVLDFPGAISCAKTLKGARRMLQDALVQVALARIELGQPLPKPNPDVDAPDAEIVEPIYLLLTATREVHLVAGSGVTA
jgi:predicted RNase H-like HicB family nuclease